MRLPRNITKRLRGPLFLTTFVSRLELCFKFSNSRRPSFTDEAQFGSVRPANSESLDTSPESTETQSLRSQTGISVLSSAEAVGGKERPIWDQTLKTSTFIVFLTSRSRVDQLYTTFVKSVIYQPSSHECVRKPGGLSSVRRTCPDLSAALHFLLLLLQLLLLLLLQLLQMLLLPLLLLLLQLLLLLLLLLVVLVVVVLVLVVLVVKTLQLNLKEVTSVNRVWKHGCR